MLWMGREQGGTVREEREEGKTSEMSDLIGEGRVREPSDSALGVVPAMNLRSDVSSWDKMSRTFFRQGTQPSRGSRQRMTKAPRPATVGVRLGMGCGQRGAAAAAGSRRIKILHSGPAKLAPETVVRDLRR